MSTGKILALIGIILALLLATVFFVLMNGSPANTPVPASDTALPPITSSSKVAVEGANGTSIQVSDFLHNGETTEDPQNPGHFTLAGVLDYCLADGTCPSGATSPNFSIEYNEKYQLFDVLLLTEPIGKARRSAEKFLMSRLGIGEGEMCRLNSSVEVTYWVNETYTGEELGFSFCPGAVVLPE